MYLNGEPVAMKAAGAWYWFLCDHLGTPQKLIDNSGNLVWEAAYLPFGKARVITADIENNLRFPGQYFDAETGLHYNWHRYYDPELGRYITADPIGLEGGINLYAYVNGNPLNFIDPSGGNPLLLGVVAISAYYLLANPDTANAPSSPCEQIYNSYGAEKILGEGLLDIAAVGILSKIFKFAPKSRVNDVIGETLNANKKNITSNHTLTANEALEAGEKVSYSNFGGNHFFDRQSNLYVLKSTHGYC